MKNKDQLADDEYGEEFKYLSPGEKATITRRYNAQARPRARATTTRANAGVKASIGRVGVNGTQPCLLSRGATIQDLLDQSGYGFDSGKEKILDNDTGLAVELFDIAKHNGTYAIAVEIKSA